MGKDKHRAQKQDDIDLNDESAMSDEQREELQRSMDDNDQEM